MNDETVYDCYARSRCSGFNGGSTFSRDTENHRLIVRRPQKGPGPFAQKGFALFATGGSLLQCWNRHARPQGAATVSEGD